MAIALIFLLLWAMLVASKGTPFGNSLRRQMVELPSAALNQLHRGHVGQALVLALLAIVVMYFQAPDGLRMMGLAIPDAVVWLTTLEVGTYVDVMVSILAATAMLRLNNVQMHLTNAFSLCRRALRNGRPRSRTSRRKTHASPANDDEEGAVMAIAS